MKRLSWFSVSWLVCVVFGRRIWFRLIVLYCWSGRLCVLRVNWYSWLCLLFRCRVRLLKLNCRFCRLIRILVVRWWRSCVRLMVRLVNILSVRLWLRINWNGLIYVFCKVVWFINLMFIWWVVWLVLLILWWWLFLRLICWWLRLRCYLLILISFMLVNW